ncbi:MAG: TolC family protein [Burkholderiaceae bacterium]|jgi:hypothetical protein|nr:TolC family protein [Burkholderiaceae bacterium]
MSIEPCRRPLRRLARLPWAAALAASLASVSHANDWKSANDEVGAFTRGHADILRWERANAPAQAPSTPPQGEPWTLEQVVAAAMRTRPDLLATRGMSALERAQLRVDARAFALQAERAWIRAVAAQQAAAYQRQVLEAAEAGAELAQRMLRVGNWSAARQMQEELTLLDAQAQALAARHAATAALADLARLLPPPAGGERLLALDQVARHLPPRLPALSGSTAPDVPALEQQALLAHPRWSLMAADAERQERGLSAAARENIAQTIDGAVVSAQGVWPATIGATQVWPHAWDKAARDRAEADALERRIRADVQVAVSSWLAAQALAQGTLQEVQRVQAALEEDMVQRYNGMLKSTWDVLASARDRVRAVNAALQAQRDAWLAHAELQAVLAGLPYTGSAPGADTGVANAAAKGH